MKRIIVAILCCSAFFMADAQQIIQFHHAGVTDQYTLVEGDSIYFDTNHTNLFFLNNSGLVEYVVADIDSISFVNDISENVYVHFQGNTAMVTNPWAGNGVEVETIGADVMITSTSLTQDINYFVEGSSTDGSLKIYSDKRFNLLLNEVSLTNPFGPAINIQSDKKVSVNLIPASSNSVTDGMNYDAPLVVDGVEEDQKSTFFSNGQIEVIGGGSLIINSYGTTQHALASDDEIDIREGNIGIASASVDGIHSNNGYYQSGGVVVVNANSDGIDTESGAIVIDCGELTVNVSSPDINAMTSDSTITIHGGSINLNVYGNQSKGLQSDMGMSLNGGVITGNSSGDAVLIPTGSGNEPAYCSLISSNGNIFIQGAELNLNTSGKGGRCISGDASVVMNAGIVHLTCSGNGATYTNSSAANDAYHSTGVKVDGDFHLIGGECSISNSGTGGKGIDVDGQLIIGDTANEPVVNVTTTGASITISGGGGGGGPSGGNNGNYDESKTVKVDGDVTIHNGNITIDSANDGIKSLGTVTINHGELSIVDSYEAIEAPFITVNDGEVSLVSSDDGFNATHGTGGESNDGSMLTINGGTNYVDASGGDAIDSNGNVTITGGVTAVHGPQSSPEVGMDYNGVGNISGGFIVISGTNSNMTQGFNNSSTQRSVTMKTTQSVAANTVFHIQDSNGNEVLTFKPKRSYYSVVFSSPLLVNGSSYTIYTGGSSSGSVTNGLYTGGAYTPGTQETTFTVNGIITTVNF